MLFRCEICSKTFHVNKYRFLVVLREHLEKEHGNPGGFVLQYFKYAKYIVKEGKGEIEWVDACNEFPC